ncbi:MAG: PepSY domain-containing protein [Hyphomicrobiales bacterium]
MSVTAAAREQAISPASSRLYRAVWRWHFYAGLYVVPFLLMLAVTGLMILWFTTLAPEYGDRLAIKSAGSPQSITTQSAAVLAAYPGRKIGQYIAPYGPHNPALFRVDLEDGNRIVAVDPYTGTILQDRAQDGTWKEFATKIHGTLLIGGDGGPGDFLIEVAASLGILLLVTGLYMWWPRSPEGWLSAIVPDFSATGRTLWKSLHSATGFWMSLIMLFFFISGLSWAGVWGGKYMQAWSTFPAQKWDDVPLSDQTHASMNHGSIKEVPWALEQTLMPTSGSKAGIEGLPEGVPVVLESVVALGRAIGFDGRFQVTAPKDEKGVWTLSQDSMSYDSPDPMSDRTVHVDQYTGKILASVGYDNYSVPGKAMAVGIALHEGQMGYWNIALNFIFCLSIIFMCLSGIVMWWKRRPIGTISSPLYPRDFRIPIAIGILAIGLGMLFPLGGLAIALFAVVDYLLPKRWKEAGYGRASS